MSKTRFSFHFLIFFIVALILNQIAHNIPTMSIEILGIYYLLNAGVYWLFSRTILKYGRQREFRKNDFRKVFIIFGVSFLFFPIILQALTLFLCLYMDNRDKEISGEPKKSSNIKEIFKNIFIMIIIVFLASMYLFGGYKIIVDKEYNAKHMILGFIIPPYTVYIGVLELFDDDTKKQSLKLSDSEKMAQSFDRGVERRLSY